MQGGFTSIVGTFGADGVTQALAFETSSNAPILNADVLRETSAVPLPASGLLLLPAIVGLGAARRRA